MKNEYIHNQDGTTTVFDKKRNGTIFETKISSDMFEKMDSIKSKWNVIKYGPNNYRVRSTINNKKVYLHRFLLDAPVNLVVDHVDGNPLNNTSVNLRLVSALVNSWKKVRREDTKYKKFITYIKLRDQYRVRVTVNGIKLSFGYYKNLDDASRIVDAILLYGQEIAKQKAIEHSFAV
jgi:hypothetical protein